MADSEILRQNNFRTRNKRVIKVVVLDIDGVLTDGAIYVNSDGEETKKIIVAKAKLHEKYEAKFESNHTDSPNGLRT